MCGSEPTSGSSAAVRSAIARTSSFGSLPEASQRTIPVHECPPCSIASRTYQEYRHTSGRSAAIVNSGVRCPGASSAITAFCSGGRYVTRWLLM